MAFDQERESFFDDVEAALRAAVPQLAEWVPWANPNAGRVRFVPPKAPRFWATPFSRPQFWVTAFTHKDEVGVFYGTNGGDAVSRRDRLHGRLRGIDGHDGIRWRPNMHDDGRRTVAAAPLPPR